MATGFTLDLSITESEVNIANNTSKVTVGVTARSTASGYSAYNYNTTSCTVACDGQRKSFNVNGFNIPNLGSAYLGSVSFIITHNTDGSKTVSASAEHYTNMFVGTITGSGSKVLTKIARATTPTLTYADGQKRLGTVLTINTPRASASFTHTVKYEFGALKGTIASGVATSTAWTLPLALANQITNSVSGTGSIIVDTYNGSSLIGSKSIKFDVLVADNMIPSFTSVTAARVDNGVPSSFGVYVESISKATLTINGAAGSYGSTIKSYSIAGGGTSTTKASDTLGPFNQNGSVVFTATITDSRGRTASKTVTITIYDYNVPTLTMTVKRCNSAGTDAPAGTYVSIVPTYSVASVGGKNAVASKRFEVVGTTYVNTACASGAKCVLGAGAIAVNSEYTIKGTVTDTLGKKVEITATVKVAEASFNILQNAKGVCFGAYATKQNTLESKWVIDAIAGVKTKGYEAVYFSLSEAWTE